VVPPGSGKRTFAERRLQHAIRAGLPFYLQGRLSPWTTLADLHITTELILFV
jgi:hypothetical protein